MTRLPSAADVLRSERLHGALVCYGIQNVVIALSAAAAAVLVWVDQSEAGAFRTRQPVSADKMVGSALQALPEGTFTDAPELLQPLPRCPCSSQLAKTLLAACVAALC